MRAYTSPGGTSADEARALETAVAREVWEKFDEVIEDLASSDNGKADAARSNNDDAAIPRAMRPDAGDRRVMRVND